MTEKKTTSRGPRRATYIPQQFREIKGVENVSTRNQLLRLRTYVETPAADRAPYVRLGASVPNYRERPGALPHSTYAVSVDGIVEVIHLQMDPRRAEMWFSCRERPWNLAAEFVVEGAGK